MAPKLAVILSTVDLPEAELCAARLDGELFSVDGCFSPVDQVEVSTVRAMALASLLPDRLIAEQHTAAWIMGVIDLPPRRHQFCAAIGARARPANPHRMSIREVVITDSEIGTYGGLRVTTPLRTAVDITRCSPTFPLADQALVRALLAFGNIAVEDCHALIALRRNLPGKRRTLERLGSLKSTTQDSLLAS